MDRASSLIFPGSKTLATWFRQIAAWQPVSFAVGYAFVHRVEAPVHALCEVPVDPLAHHLLQALSLEDAGGLRASALQERLRLPGPMMQRVLAGMKSDGLLQGGGNDPWRMTERGQLALAQRSMAIYLPRRRALSFVELLDPAGQRTAVPHFLALAECVHVPWQVAESHRFDADAVRAAIEQNCDWKSSWGFPLDIEVLPADAPLETWEQVVIDRPERVLLALVRNADQVQGFAVKVDDWTLYDRSAVVRLPGVDPSAPLWPEATQAPEPAILKEAWRIWCKQRQLPAAEVESCTLSYAPPRLEVQAPPRLVQRLQAARSDLFKGDAWVLVGDGFVRTAVRLALQS